MGRVPTLHPRTLARSSTSTTNLTMINLLFSKLIFSPKIVSNHMRTQHKCSLCSLLASQRMSISSANSRWDTSISSPPPSAENPAKKPPFLALHRIQERASMAIMKRYRDRRPPCLKPLVLRKNLTGSH